MFKELIVLFHTTVWLIRNDIQDVGLIMQHRNNEPALVDSTLYVDMLIYTIKQGRDKTRTESRMPASEVLPQATHTAMQQRFRLFFWSSTGYFSECTHFYGSSP